MKITATSFKRSSAHTATLSAPVPGAGALPLVKVMGKEARHTQRQDGASGVTLEILEHLPPKPECLLSALCFHLHL